MAHRTNDISASSGIHDPASVGVHNDAPNALITHFPGLNSLRFIAAYLVVLSHGEAIRTKRGIAGYAELSLFHNGALAVSFFFVLSGFLITYLLLKEHAAYGNISVRRFYLRRVLRILPLYYLLVVLGLVVVPRILAPLGIANPMSYDPSDVAVWYLLVLPFVVNIFHDVFVIGPLWSIGVEELYYLFIAPLMRFMMKYIAIVFTSLIILKIVLLVCCEFGFIAEPAASFVRLLAFEQMAIGGLCAWWLFGRSASIEASILWRRPMQIMVYVLIAARILFHSSLCELSPIYTAIMSTPVWSDILFGLLFAWIIVEVSVNRHALIRVQWHRLESLGDISYGVYMYHNLVAFVLTYSLYRVWVALPVMLSTLVFHLCLGVGTIVIAQISKRWYENYFLSLKAHIR